MTTVSKQALLNMAADIEKCADKSLKSWILLGQTEKYSQAMDKAFKIRNAISLPVAQRREVLASI